MTRYPRFTRLRIAAIGLMIVGLIVIYHELAPGYWPRWWL